MLPTFEGKRTRNAYSRPCASRDYPVVWSAEIIGRFWALSTIRNTTLAGFSVSGHVLAEPGSTEHHHKAMIVAHQMTALPPRKPPFGIAPSPPPRRPGAASKLACKWPRQTRSRAVPALACHTPGVPHSITRAACIGRSVDGSDAQVHNSMFHNILAS